MILNLLSDIAFYGSLFETGVVAILIGLAAGWILKRIEYWLQLDGHVRKSGR